MCFSKEISFIASGLLAIAGACSIGIVAKRRQWRFIFFASIPLLFAAQQFCEGFVWHFINKNNVDWTSNFSLAYLFFAFFFWPFWIPLSLYFIEKNRRFIFSIFTLYGVIIATSLFIFYLSKGALISTTVINKSLCYSTNPSAPHEIAFILYLLATIGPMCFSSRVMIKILGAFGGLCATISYLINRATFVSVWCFLSALISIFIIFITYRETELSI
jgi:hypothetical protein